MRYLNLSLSLARFALARELAFRANFLVKVFVEVLWLSILLVFYRTVFGKTATVAGWDESRYLFYVGCFFALNGLIETLFLENCNEFAELVRKGDLDFLLLKPIDEQFLITCRRFDWATAPNVLMGAGLMLFAMNGMGWPFGEPLWQAAARVAGFVVLFASGAVIAYSFIVILTAMSVWMVRNQSLMELWWLFSSLARAPKEIFSKTWAEPIGRFFTYAVPVLVMVNVPAEVMVRAFDPALTTFTLAAAVVLFWTSRVFFRRALRSYRSASS